MGSLKSDEGEKMKLKIRRFYLLLCCLGIAGGYLLIPRSLMAQPCEDWAGKIVSIQGTVEVRKAGEIRWVLAKLNETFCSGDMVRVYQNSRAAIVLTNESLIRIDQNTTIAFKGLDEQETFLLDIFSGIAHFFSRFPRKLKVKTSFVNAAIEGTEFYIRVTADEALLSIFEGRVAASNEVGALALAGGQSAIARASQAPVLQTVVRPRDAVQWALYYPPIVNWMASDFSGGGESGWQASVRRSISHYWQGDITRAFDALEKIPDKIDDARFLLYRAALFLTVGRVDRAQAAISQALQLDSSNSQAFALQSIIEVVQNQKIRALDLAKKAVELNPEGAAARVALSYAQQSQFDLQAALASLEEAVTLDAENALIWARLAEMHLSVGDLDKSAKAAQMAVKLNPHLARTQTISGFAFVTRIKIKQAEEAFQKAIALDSADPLPRLGLGLAKIRGGNLKAGRAEIEIAASLDPNNSLIRSYLGKAYFDEKRDNLSRNQFELAKQLDPLDPTPWFYDAIRKQTTNRPVEALQDLQKSIELNDNRAVYRSRLQLDQDLAARSAGIGRIFNDLGFQQLALVEGWKSVNTDPTNYSAHRLLADSYLTLPRHEIAKVSELLQSQLLQPLNITPVQPQLAASNLFILEGSGPSDPSFNEFNPLFLRNRLALQTSGVLGNKDTWGDDVAQSGVWNNFSYSLGQFHYETDGFRQNNDQKQDVLNAFMQASLSPKTSVLGEARYRDRDFGDLEILFDPDAYQRDLRQDLNEKTYRLGVRHGFAPGSDVIASFIAQDFEEHIDDVIPVGTNDIKESTDGYLGEAQYLLRMGRFNLISGGGYYDADFEQRIDFNSALPPIILPSSSSTENRDIHHFNGYLYAQLRNPRNLTFTAGAGFDSFDDDRTDCDQLNPKFGLVWNPFPHTTLRAAVFRLLTRTLIADETIEPTQVAGFNQFFDDVPGTDIWTYGGAIDHRFSGVVFAGAEFYKRDLEVPYEDVLVASPTAQFRRTDWEEYVGRAYLYWAPHPWLATRVEYQYEKFDRGDEFSGIEEIVDLKMHRFQLGARFYHPSGFFAGLQTAYVYQDGDFGDPAAAPIVGDDDDFWVVDAGVGYRLPRRFGMLSIEAKNLFDEDFKFQDTDPAKPTIAPERLILGRVSLAF